MTKEPYASRNRSRWRPEPDAFPSTPGTPFPLYDVLAEVAKHKDPEVIACRSSDPLVAVGLALRRAGATTVLVANMTPQPQLVELEDKLQIELDGYTVDTCRAVGTPD